MKEIKVFTKQHLYFSPLVVLRNPFKLTSPIRKAFEIDFVCLWF